MPYDYAAVLDDFPGEEEVKARFLSACRGYLGCRHAIGVTTGTSAIEIVLRALDLPLGASVIVPDLSFIATATAVANCGLVPEYADVSPVHFGMSLAGLREAWHPGVRAVIYVHFAGVAGRELLDIRAFCAAHGVALLEDCAQAFGATIEGRRVGTVGTAGTFSFQSSKILNAGEGGLVVTDDPELAAACEAIANWGMSPARPLRNLELASSNLRLGALQAWFLHRQLRDIEGLLARRRQRVGELTRACQRTGLASRVVPAKAGWEDCPFFFPVASQVRRHTVEPRSESPMWRSRIVPSILAKFFPTLLPIYEDALPLHGARRASAAIIDSVDFLNISQGDALPATEIVAPYREQAAA